MQEMYFRDRRVRVVVNLTLREMKLALKFKLKEILQQCTVRRNSKNIQ